MPKVLKQLSCTNYNLFHLNAINRADESLEAKPRPDLLASMKKHGFRKTNPIICIEQSGGFLVVDGHNRLAAAKALGLPIEYIAYPPEEYVNPLEFSLGQKAWTGRDILEGYAKSGLDAYAEILEFCEWSGISANAAMALHRGNLPSSGNNFIGMIREGRYEITEREFPKRVATLWGKLKELSLHAQRQLMLHSVARILLAKGFDADVLIEKAARYPDLIRKCRTVDETIQMLEDIYNRSRRGEKYYLSVEVEKAMRARNMILNVKRESDNAIQKAKARLAQRLVEKELK